MPTRRSLAATALTLGQNRRRGCGSRRWRGPGYRATPPFVRPVAEGLLLCAERMLAADQAAEAVRDLRPGACCRTAQAENCRSHPRCHSARRGEGTALLVEQLKSSDKDMFAIGLAAARELSGDAVTRRC